MKLLLLRVWKNMQGVPATKNMTTEETRSRGFWLHGAFLRKFAFSYRYIYTLHVGALCGLNSCT